MNLHIERQGFLSQILGKSAGKLRRHFDPTFPIVPMPTIPRIISDGSEHGTWSFLQRPLRAELSARVVSRTAARIRNMAISAVGSEVESRVLQNHMPCADIQSTSNSL